MKANLTRRILWTFFAVMAFATAQGAHAGLFRTYLSVNGNDANPCTVAAPCRLLPAALAAVNDGGEVWMLDSANFNTGIVTITKSVTILAVPGALGSVVANGDDAIYINIPGGKVTLRNLNVLNLIGSFNWGVWMDQGAALTVENCEIYGMHTGINAVAANSVVAIKTTVIRDTTNTGVNISGTVKATLDGVQLLNGSLYGAQVSAGASAVVSKSVVAGNASRGILVYSASGTNSRLVVADTVINANATGIWGGTITAADAASITLQNSTITGNTTGVDTSTAAATSAVTVVLDGNALIGNTTAINYVSPAVVHSRGNNTLKLNGADVTGPALTLLAGQ